MTLHARLVGSGRPNVLFLHGLFGQGRNWSGIAKALQPVATSVLFDLPNHGRSPHTDHFSYVDMADAVAHDLTERLGSAAAITVVGHSMGGKVAMIMALRHPELVKGLVVVDISPDASSHDDEFERIIDALRSVDLATLTSRDEASEQISGGVPSPTVRAFLLQNLRHRKHAWSWQVNLPLLDACLPEVFGWPDEVSGTYEGPVLWISGEESGYVRSEHQAPMLGYFPRTELLTVPGSGHWVHSDEPDLVVGSIRNFLVTHHLDRPEPA